MTKPLKLPYPPLIVLATEGTISWDTVLSKIKDRLEDGVSICITAGTGRENRGGYFFHMKSTPDGIRFSTFDRDAICVLKDGHDCELFINHVMGYEFSDKMWELSQLINLRTDEYT